MKFITSTVIYRHVPMTCALLGALLLSACSGGGGASSVATAAPAAPATTLLASFTQSAPAPDFSWSNAAKPVRPAVKLSAPPGALVNLVGLTLLISNYTCKDPSGATGMLASPLRTDQITALSTTTETGATLDLAGLNLQVPAATAYLLVEVMDGNIALYSKLVPPASLASLNISSLDQRQPTFASCANPG